MVGRAVAFDAGKIAAREIRMHNAEVDSEERNTDLGMDFPSLVLQRPLDGVLERAFRGPAGRCEGLRNGLRALLGEFEEVLEIYDAPGVGSAKVDLFGAEGRKDQKLAPGAGHGHI